MRSAPPPQPDSSPGSAEALGANDGSLSRAPTSGEVLKPGYEAPTFAPSGPVPSCPDGDHDVATLRALTPGTILGGCEIVRLVGAGAYGEVYLAVDPEGEEWAIKRMQLVHKDDKKARQRFLQEARILQYVRHPNIVLCDDFGADAQGNLWMKLEYLEGATLRELTQTEGRMSIDRAMRVGRQACQGLYELHKAKAAHRDVKPENLFLIESDLLKILDFGLVKVAESSLKTTRRVALGTALYFAPDYLERDSVTDGDAPDPRWDVYSLGMTLYEMLAGHPFVIKLGKVPVPVVAAKMHLIGEIPPLAEQGVPEEIASVIMKSIARDPAERYADGGQFERALTEVHKRWLAGRLRETEAPQTQSAEVRLSHATTEPDVVQQLERGSTLPPPPDSVVSTVQQTRTDPMPPESTTGAQGTVRMVVPPALVRPRRASEPPPVTPPRSTLRAAGTQSTLPLERGPLKSEKALPFAGPVEAAIRHAGTEPLDARDVVAPRSSKIAEKRRPEREVPEGDPEGENPFLEHEPKLPRSEKDRRRAELEVWLEKGYLPAEVATQLGLRPGPAAGAPATHTTAEGASRAKKGARREKRARAWAPWSRDAKLGLIAVTAGALGCAAVVIFGIVLRSRHAPTATAVTVPIVSASAVVTAKAAPASDFAPEPAPSGDVPPEPYAAASASATAAPSTSASSSAAPSSTKPSGASTTWRPPKPKSSRANDLYNSLHGDDELLIRPKSAKPAVSQTPTASGKTQPPPSRGPILPFGVEDD